MKFRTLIVDDEPLARERLRQLLKEHPEVEVLGEAKDGLEAVAAIQEWKPDLVFLDVQMPELDGFGVLEQVPKDGFPAIIFVTAHDQFALRAFEVHALDYLLKPFDRERFETALERALKQLRTTRVDALSSRLTGFIADLKQKVPERLLVKSEGRLILVKYTDVDWLEAADNYVQVHTGAETHMIRETLSNMESRLPANFMRVSRSAIVNLDKIKELQPLFHGDYVVILQNGKKVTLTRSYRDKLEELLNKLS